MRRLATILALGLAVLACSGPAAKKRQRSSVPAIVNDSPQTTKPFLWRVAGPGGKAPTYMLGTMHVGVDPFKAFSTALWKAFDDSSVLVLEVDATGPQALGLGMQPIGQSLEKQMKPEQWKTLLAALKVDPAGSKAERLATYRPWVIVAEITNLAAPQVPNIDGSLHQRARKLGKRLAFLEGAKVQAAILDKFATVEYLLDLVKDIPGYARGLREDVKLYLSGDEVGFAKSAIEDMTRQIGEKGMEALLYQRNRRWMPLIEKHIAAGGAFIAVGNAHMLGDKSVVALLRAKGYQVERVAM
jgi:uncharacterized protein YbaP (TraB family)